MSKAFCAEGSITEVREVDEGAVTEQAYPFRTRAVKTGEVLSSANDILCCRQSSVLGQPFSLDIHWGRESTSPQMTSKFGCSSSERLFMHTRQVSRSNCLISGVYTSSNILERHRSRDHRQPNSSMKKYGLSPWLRSQRSREELVQASSAASSHSSSSSGSNAASPPPLPA